MDGMADAEAGTAMTLSPVTQDYLKFIYELEQAEGRATTSHLAELLGVTDAAATKMAKRLDELALVERTPYKGVTLTAEGRRRALEVLRHHRLLELYLVRVLGFPWEKVHQEAEALEHAISEDFEERIDRALGYPTVDVHGAPIPTREGTIDPQAGYIPLADLEPGANAAIRRVQADRRPEVLTYLGTIGLEPGVELAVARRDPFGGPLTVETPGARHVISLDLARLIFVEPLPMLVSQSSQAQSTV